MAWLLDAHIHLSDPEYASNMDVIVNSMDRLGLRACAVSMDNESSKNTLAIAARSDHVLPFIGIHPEKAADDLDMMVDLIRNNAAAISGIGEIGLDKTYCSDEAQFKRQHLVFSTLLEVAEKLHKPVSVHSRKTLDEVLDMIPSYKTGGFLLHWFDGSKKQLARAMDLGCFVSYGPVMVYSQDKQVMASASNRDKILVETDGPVKFSHCFGMKAAQISFIPSVMFALSKTLGQSYDETEAMLEGNAKRYLRI
ncbi:TatD family hydrolase [Candidatus Nitrosotenuis cloacae]|uniref:TatD family hydrolase n=1 Tax=Candidatus Nitrosotenuis cloacae TaxID=1603555 RepID=UPI00227E020C|nr:TatD family hydrolase [Candidatus Nitrosotenuis cloacae]